jgi:hypothetical protein
MATSIQQMTLGSSLKIIRDTDADATSESNVTGAAATISLIEVDNTANASTTVFLKLYNSAAPTIGTTAPDIVIPAGGGQIVRAALASATAISFATGLSFACVTNGGGTAGTTSPVNDVAVAIVAA